MLAGLSSPSPRHLRRHHPMDEDEVDEEEEDDPFLHHQRRASATSIEQMQQQQRMHQVQVAVAPSAHQGGSSWEERALTDDQLNFRTLSASMDKLDLEINPPTDR